MSSTRPTPIARRRARLVLAAALAALPLVAAVPARAALEGDFERDPGPILTTWYGPADPGAKRADLGYVAGMRPHHAGALTMSEAYLADPASSSPLLRQLARAIVVNQAFEVLMLDEVERNLARPPVRIGFVTLQPMATAGLAQARQFRRMPVPGPLNYAVTPVSERDVQFAKAMIIHHEGALSMARAYNADPAARNTFLGLFNVDVLTDQAQEIALMRWAIRAYPGDPAAVQVDPSMIHGMEGMDHGAHGGAAEPPAAPAAAPDAPAPRAPSGRGGHAHHH